MGEFCIKFIDNFLVDPSETCRKCNGSFSKNPRSHIVSFTVTNTTYDLYYMHAHCLFKPYHRKLLDSLEYGCKVCHLKITVEDEIIRSRLIWQEAHYNDIIHKECGLAFLTLKERENNFLRNIKNLLVLDKEEIYLNSKLKHTELFLQEQYKIVNSTEDKDDRKFFKIIVDSVKIDYENILYSYAKKKKVETYKEELMSKIWHPDRYHIWKHLLEESIDFA